VRSSYGIEVLQMLQMLIIISEASLINKPAEFKFGYAWQALEGGMIFILDKVLGCALLDQDLILSL